MVFWTVVLLFSCFNAQSQFRKISSTLHTIRGQTDQIESSHRRTSGIYIETVSTKKRALDVKCFRGFSVSVSEYISRRGLSISEDEAIDQMMEGYYENGDIINHKSPHEREVYFAAVYYNQNSDDESVMLRKKFSYCNGVVGVCSAQVRNRKTSCSGEVLTFLLTNRDDIDRVLCLPHVFLANMKVDDCMRRQGVASELLSSVTAYAKHQDDVDFVILDVDNDNLGAIQLYKKNGFEYIHRNSHLGYMAKFVPKRD